MNKETVGYAVGFFPVHDALLAVQLMDDLQAFELVAGELRKAGPLF